MEELSMFQENKIGKFKFMIKRKQENMPKRSTTQGLHSRWKVNSVYCKPKDKFVDLFIRSFFTYQV